MNNDKNAAWPRSERPREKLLNQGEKSLTNAELLAIFLRTGTKDCNVMQLSHQLLNHFGSLHNLLSADQSSFCQYKGLGVAKYVQVKASLEMVRRYLQEDLSNGACLDASYKTAQYLSTELKHEHNEVFAVLMLNNQHQIITFKKLFYGTIDAAAVYPRVVAEESLVNKAAAVILCHNHPSGVAEPSRADIQITRRIVDALALLDIRVLDHVIIAGNQTISLAERGLM